MKVLDQYQTDRYSIYNGDTTEIIKAIPDDSIGLSVFSPPFSQLYTYTNSDRDLGNSRNDEEFFTHFEFIVKELYRILMPGRVVAIHCMQIPAMKERDGYIGLKDFRGDLIRLFQKCGFIFHSEVTIWKNPVVEMQRTKALGLLHKQIKKDSSKTRMGLPDYIIFMRKDGDNPNPITHTNDTFPVDLWQDYASPVWEEYASPVWWNINQSNTLNRMFADEESEKHICFAEGSLVLSKRGYVPIETLEVGIDEVLTNSGEWHKVIAKAKTKENADVVQVKANGVPYLVCTPNHKIMAKPFHRWGGQVKKAALKLENEEWTEAKDCKEHYLKSVLPPEMESSISADEWWLIGRWVADGHIDARGHQYFISVGNHKWDIFVEHANKWIGAVNEKPEDNCKQVGLKNLSKDARDILEKIGKHADEKKLPVEIISLNKELSKSFLDGYESGDGHVRNNKRYYSSASRSLLLGMSIVAQKVYGCVPSVYAGRSERTQKIKGRKVHCKQEWIMTLSPHYSFSFTDECGTWKKVKDVLPKDKADVWSIEVEKDHSYMCEGAVVKNCPLQLDVIERCVKLYSRDDDTVFTPFMGIGSEVYQSVKMGRKAIGIELKKEYFLQAKKNLQALDDESKQMTFEDYFNLKV